MFLLLLAVFLLSYSLLVIIAAGFDMQVGSWLRLMFSVGCVLLVYVIKYQV